MRNVLTDFPFGFPKLWVNLRIKRRTHGLFWFPQLNKKTENLVSYDFTEFCVCIDVPKLIRKNISNPIDCL